MPSYPFDIRHFYIEQTGQGQPVIFIHGFTLDARMWNTQWDFFKDRYNCIRYDLRGYSRSGLLQATPLHPYAHFEDLHYIINELNIGPAVLIGLSMGGRIAMQCALEFPGDVKGLVLIDAAIDGYPWQQEYVDWLDSFEDILAKKGIDEARKEWLQGKLFASAMSNPAVAPQLEEIVRSFGGLQWTNADPSYQTQSPSFTRLEQISCPILTLVGEHDLPDFLSIAGEIENRVSGSTKIIVPNAGHCSNMENPDFVNRHILEWCTAL